jgi:multiple antibiotic resistance protein
LRAQPSPTRSTAVEQAESREREDVAIVPLTVLMMGRAGRNRHRRVLMSRADAPLQVASVFAAIALTGLACWLLLRAAAGTEELLRRTTIRVVERVMGLVLVAVAVEFVFSGLRYLLPTLQAVNL